MIDRCGQAVRGPGSRPNALHPPDGDRQRARRQMRTSTWHHAGTARPSRLPKVN